MKKASSKAGSFHWFSWSAGGLSPIRCVSDAARRKVAAGIVPGADKKVVRQ